MVRIKVCGITNKKDALAAARLGAWALGFNFYKKSPRYVLPEAAQKIIRALPKRIIPVGVFVNEREGEVRRIAKLCGLKALQFHGNETPLFCKKFKGLLTIKAIRLKNKANLNQAVRYKTRFILFDAYQKDLFGGTGKSFDWALLKSGKIGALKIILSGGLNPENITQAVQSVKAYAVDVASGVERRPGKKCQRLMKKFFNNAKGK